MQRGRGRDRLSVSTGRTLNSGKVCVVLQDINIISLVGGAVAAFAAGKLLLSAKYPGTWPLVCRRSSAFWRYVLYYGVLGTLVTGIILRTELGHFQVIAGIPREIFWPIIVGLVGTFAKFSFVG